MVMVPDPNPLELELSQDRAELLRICKAQQAVVDEVHDILESGKVNQYGIAVPPLYWDALCDAVEALRAIEQ